MKLLKNFADLLEKMAAGALLVGLFQDNQSAIMLGSLMATAWLVLRIVEYVDAA